MYIYKRRQSGEISQTGRQPIPDRRSDAHQKISIFKSFSLEDRRVREAWSVQSEAER